MLLTFGKRLVHSLTLDETLEHFRLGAPAADPEEERTPYMALLKEFNLHFELRDLVDNPIKHAMENPEPQNGYMWIDWIKVIS